MVSTLKNLLSGKERAYRVFWYWGGAVLFFVSLLSLGADIFLPQLSGVMLFVYDTCCALWSVAMWRCAFNETHHVWGYVYRFFAIVMLATVLVDVPSLWDDDNSPALLSTNGIVGMAQSDEVQKYVKLCQEEIAHQQGSDAAGMAQSLMLSQCLMRHVQELQKQPQP